MIFHQKLTPAEEGRQRLISKQILNEIRRTDSVRGNEGYRIKYGICEPIAALKENWKWKLRTAYRRRRAFLKLEHV